MGSTSTSSSSSTGGSNGFATGKERHSGELEGPSTGMTRGGVHGHSNREGFVQLTKWFARKGWENQSVILRFLTEHTFCQERHPLQWA